MTKSWLEQNIGGEPELELVGNWGIQFLVVCQKQLLAKQTRENFGMISWIFEVVYII